MGFSSADFAHRRKYENTQTATLPTTDGGAEEGGMECAWESTRNYSGGPSHSPQQPERRAKC
eukprot:9467059-Pyramimonas_sp.AAC.2